jgi:hypothetical protein
MDAMILSTVHRRRILKAAAGTSFPDVGSLREDRLKYSTVLTVRCDLGIFFGEKMWEDVAYVALRL